MFPQFKRIFCDDLTLRNTLKDLAGKFGTALLDRLKQPAHRADIFCYIYHFCNGGLCVDIKFGFVVPWSEILKPKCLLPKGQDTILYLRASCLMNLW